MTIKQARDIKVGDEIMYFGRVLSISTDKWDKNMLIFDCGGRENTAYFYKDSEVNLKEPAPAPPPAAPPAAEFPPRQADGTINPKDAAALKRVPMHLLPQVGIIYGAMACRDGALKYGPYNWRERAISLTQYIGAMQRHLASLLDGEDNAQDSQLPHLAHVLATAAILLDAQNAGALLDDRPKRPGDAAGLIAKLNAQLAATLAPAARLPEGDK